MAPARSHGRPGPGVPTTLKRSQRERLIDAETVGMFALVAPAMLIPNLIGARLYSRVTETTFRRLVLALLSCTGIAMLAAALPRIVAD